MNRVLSSLLAGAAVLATLPASGADLSSPYMKGPPAFSWTGITVLAGVPKL